MSSPQKNTVLGGTSLYSDIIRKISTENGENAKTKAASAFQNVRFFSFPSGEMGRKAEPDKSIADMPLFCRFLYRFSDVDIFRIISLL